MVNLHWSNFAPRKSGLYECTKDQILYERKMGIDSQMAIYENENPNNLQDDWLKPVSWDWAKKADIFVVHRGLPVKVQKLYPTTKRVVVLHGTSEFLILEDIFSEAEKQNFNSHINFINNNDATTIVNQHDYDILKLYDYNNKLSLINDAIDTQKYNLKGYKYPYKNHPQILFCDSLRINKHPAHIIWAMEHIIKEIPNARLTLIGLDLLDILTWRNLLLRSKQGNLKRYCEVIQFKTDDILPYMRSADILYNSNASGIFSRVQIEALSCGCQVISSNSKFTPFNFKTYDIKDIAKSAIECWKHIEKNPAKARNDARKVALKYFSMEQKVKKEYIPLYNKILNT